MPAWFVSYRWEVSFQPLPLGALTDRDSEELLYGPGPRRPPYVNVQALLEPIYRLILPLLITGTNVHPLCVTTSMIGSFISDTSKR